jgi:hypothetical protein
MSKQRPPFRPPPSRSLALAFLVGLSCVTLPRAGSARDRTCLRIDHVGDTPGLWTGVIATEQWLDATVIKTTQKDLRVGQHVRFGIYLVKGNKLMDKSKPRLRPAVIHAGVRITLLCQAVKGDGAIYDPKCIQTGCRSSLAGAQR